MFVNKFIMFVWYRVEDPTKCIQWSVRKVMEDIEINVGPIYRFKWKYVYIILVCRSIASIPSTFVNS